MHSRAGPIADLEELRRRVKQAEEIMVDERGNLIWPESRDAQAVAQIPSILFQDYPVDIHLRIYREGSRYGADIFAVGQGQRFPIEMSPHDLLVLNKQLQEALCAVASDDLILSGMKSTSAHVDKQIRSLAEIGNYAFKRVFSSRDAQAIVGELLSLSSRTLIQIASEDFFLPWELIYPNSLDDPLSVEGFWGMKYIISRVIVQEHRPGAFVAPVIRIAHRPNLGLCAYCGLPGVAEKEIPFFEKLNGDGQIALFRLRALDPGKKREELREFRSFWRNDLDLAHFACHASFEDESPDLSCIVLSDEFPITLMDIEVYEITIDSHPLVVLNACETGNLNPLYTSHFAASFLRHGARGVVATECPVPDTFAADFAEQLYTRLLTGKQLGESLLATRRSFMEKHENPSGLLYSLYAPPSIRLEQVGE